MELLSAIDIALEKNLAFAAYRLPGERNFQFVLQEGEELVESQNKCFVFHPFAETEDIRPIYLRPDHFSNEDHFSQNLSLSDHLLLDPGLAKPQVKPSESTTKEEHLKRVNKAIESIKSGELIKTVMARVEKTSRGNTSMSHLLSALSEQYPSAFVCLFNHPKTAGWMCATPETLIQEKEGRYETMSLAGTKPVDGQTREWTEKEREEQQIVTEDILSRLKNAGVAELEASKPETVQAGNVYHLKSRITFRSEKSALELAKALHPTPAVNGFPLENSVRFIGETEKNERKYYAGFLGPVGIDKTTHLFVNLRCMEVYDENFVLHIGGGITKDSEPESEWTETEHKAATLKTVIEKLRT